MVRKRDDRYHGVLLYNKRLGITSHDAVQEVRRMTAQRSVGHTGTLDPQAEGLLVMCLGSATKIARFLTDHDKVYEAEITFGRRSATYDREGVDLKSPANRIPATNEADLKTLLDRFKGEISQTVPAYSAVRVEGRRMYKQARAGITVQAPSRKVTISKLELLDWKEPRLTLRVACSVGTYIRSLAHDLGEALGCGAYLSALRRTRVGRFDLDSAFDTDKLQEAISQDQLNTRLLTPREALDFPAITVTPEFASQVFHGRDLTSADIIACDRVVDTGHVAMLIGADSQALAVVRANRRLGEEPIDPESSGKLVSYVRVLN